MKQGTKRPRRPCVLSRYKRETRSQHVTSNIHLCLLFKPAELPPGQSQGRFARNNQVALENIWGGGGTSGGFRKDISLCLSMGRVFMLRGPEASAMGTRERDALGLCQ